MKIAIEKIGNDEGVIIPPELLKQLGWKAGDLLEIRADDKCIELTHTRDEFEAAEDFNRQLMFVRKAMRKYRVALSKLADS